MEYSPDALRETKARLLGAVPDGLTEDERWALVAALTDFGLSGLTYLYPAELLKVLDNPAYGHDLLVRFLDNCGGQL